MTTADLVDHLYWFVANNAPPPERYKELAREAIQQAIDDAVEAERRKIARSLKVPCGWVPVEAEKRKLEGLLRRQILGGKRRGGKQPQEASDRDQSPQDAEA